MITAREFIDDILNEAETAIYLAESQEELEVIMGKARNLIVLLVESGSVNNFV